MDEWAIIGAIVTAIAGIVAGAVQLSKILRNSPSRKVVDGASIVDASGELIEMYRQTLSDLRSEVMGYKDEVVGLREDLHNGERKVSQLETQLLQVQGSLSNYRYGVQVLIAQIQQAGLSPNWEPEVLEWEINLEE